MKTNLSEQAIKAYQIVSAVLVHFGLNRQWHTMVSVSEVIASVTVWTTSYAQLEEVIETCVSLGASLDEIEKRYDKEYEHYAITYKGL